jgi:hypothetical protein
VYKFARNRTLNYFIRHFGCATYLRRRHCHHRSQPFSTRNDEVRCEFGQICISGAYRGKQSGLYAFAIAIHGLQGEKG